MARLSLMHVFFSLLAISSVFASRIVLLRLNSTGEDAEMLFVHRRDGDDLPMLLNDDVTASLSTFVPGIERVALRQKEYQLGDHTYLVVAGDNIPDANNRAYFIGLGGAISRAPKQRYPSAKHFRYINNKDWAGILRDVDLQLQFQV